MDTYTLSLLATGACAAILAAYYATTIMKEIIMRPLPNETVIQRGWLSEVAICGLLSFTIMAIGLMGLYEVLHMIGYMPGKFCS